jgi:hypothetical protein
VTVLNFGQQRHGLGVLTTQGKYFWETNMDASGQLFRKRINGDADGCVLATMRPPR